jgi:bifunctional non-homologous end joining protein LigD
MAKAQTDTLGDYRAKRDFSKTAEPHGKSRTKSGRSFVIQKHAARRTHFDFRLEHNGVLKSWAVTRGPSLDPGDKRLAVRTEDHPVDYGSFEGVIPKGEYGAGPVMIWDKGTWEPLTDPDKGLADGDLKFRLKGKRLKGEWVLVRMRNKSDEKHENWLLIKKLDRYSDPEADMTGCFQTSVETGRDMAAILAGAPAKRAGSKSGVKLPAFVQPQLATLVKKPPEGDGWLHEIKYDGYRIIAAVSGDAVEYYSRSGKDWTAKFDALTPSFGKLGLRDALIDGEVVVFDRKGRSQFSMLQQALKEGNGELTFMAFDLLADDGKSLRSKPLSDRKARLAKHLKSAKGSVRYCDHIEGDGETMRIKACQMGLEGIISKRANSAYRSGRSKTWLKSKCIGRNEYVIGGWQPSNAAGRPFASILLGEFAGDVLRYRGSVGTGFSQAEMEHLIRKLKSLRQETTSFEDVPKSVSRTAEWVTPKLVAEISYTEHTKEGYLRHPSYLGLREDKPAKNVGAAKMTTANDTGEMAGVRLTSPDKVMFSEQGVTKVDLARYLADTADRILPYLAGRPLSLVRCPEGRRKSCFFQKHAIPGFPDNFRRIEIREKDGGAADYLYIEDKAGLVAAAQMGVLEFHIWGSKVDKLEKPDRLVFDLDPADDVTFNDVKNAAQDLRDVLAAADLKSFPLLTGGEGIHLVAPLERRQDWTTVKRFAAGLARKLSEAEPERFTAKASKAGRKGRIFIDWLRNARGATAIAPYSPRAHAGAPIATPVSWQELGRIKSASQYKLDTIKRRLTHLKDNPWSGYFDLRQSIREEVLALVEAN